MEKVNPSERDLIWRMSHETGEIWRGSQNRTEPNSEVVICTSPARAFYLTWAGNVEGNINGWAVEVRPLKMDDAREFFLAFGSHYYYWIGAGLENKKHTLRAYIKNGRKKDWTVSIGPCA